MVSSSLSRGKSNAHMERVDLLQLKNQLTALLKDDAAMYWSLIRQFAVAKLTRKELELYCRKKLNKEATKLHNIFLLSILHNAYCPVAPQFSSKTQNDGSKKASKKKKKGKSKAAATSPSRKRRFSDDESDENLVKRLKLSNGLHRPHKNPAFIKSLSGGRDEEPLSGHPELVALRHKMCKAASESGVTNVSNECVRLMMFALEYHVKELISKCRPKIRMPPPQPPTSMSQRCVLLSPGGGNVSSKLQLFGQLPHRPPFHLCEESAIVQHPPHCITSKDLWLAVELNPNILGENLSLSKERVLLSQ